MTWSQKHKVKGKSYSWWDQFFLLGWTNVKRWRQANKRKWKRKITNIWSSIEWKWNDELFLVNLQTNESQNRRKSSLISVCHDLRIRSRDENLDERSSRLEVTKLVEIRLHPDSISMAGNLEPEWRRRFPSERSSFKWILPSCLAPRRVQSLDSCSSNILPFEQTFHLAASSGGNSTVNRWKSALLHSDIFWMHLEQHRNRSNHHRPLDAMLLWHLKPQQSRWANLRRHLQDMDTSVHVHFRYRRIDQRSNHLELKGQTHVGWTSRSDWSRRGWLKEERERRTNNTNDKTRSLNLRWFIGVIIS